MACDDARQQQRQKANTLACTVTSTVQLQPGLVSNAEAGRTAVSGAVCQAVQEAAPDSRQMSQSAKQPKRVYRSDKANAAAQKRTKPGEGRLISVKRVTGNDRQGQSAGSAAEEASNALHVAAATISDSDSDFQ